MKDITQEAESFRKDFLLLESELNKVVLGQKPLVRNVLAALFAQGHVLVEGLPGLGKTLLVKTLGQLLDLEFSRVQFTPDLMPADILGTEILDTKSPQGRCFHPGPLFANLVLADEINRASPKTQSALLEAMQERQVTYLGDVYPLQEPFLVMATQNPIDLEGTYPLPEAQRDRFFCQLDVPYPAQQDLIAIGELTTGSKQTELRPVLDADRVRRMAQFVRHVPVGEEVKQFASSLVMATQPQLTPDSTLGNSIRYGSSPRGLQALLLAGKILALLDNRYNVSKEDIRSFALPALRHRIIPSFEGLAKGQTSDAIIRALLTHFDRIP